MPLFTIQSEFRYEIVRKIFEGGMGIVYEAQQQGARNFVKRVAMKVIRQNYANQKQFIENFERFRNGQPLEYMVDKQAGY